MRGTPAFVATFMLASLVTTGSAQQPAPDRSGFTMLVDVGVGFQRDEFFDVIETGLQGINLGFGTFLRESLALMLRTSGTTAFYDGGTQVSGALCPILQYWTNDELALEGGIGLGFWALEDADDTGLGLILGGSYSIWNNDGNSLYLGVQYAPAFTDPETVHNFGIVFGWQLF